MSMQRYRASLQCGLTLLCTVLLAVAPAAAQELPRVERRGDATQLIVDGEPYLAIAGELHNSSPSSPVYMAPIWDRLERTNVKTVIGVASWELVEPQEGRFGFAAVDDQIRQARAHGMRLVLIWFGAYKNAESTYAPSWVRRDEARFPRAERDPNAKLQGIAVKLRRGVALSAFDDRLVEADARAFAALMRHVRQVDKHRTVILVQVENEVGLIGDSRDRSPTATRVWSQPVPPELMSYLKQNRDKLRPHLRDAWGRQGFRSSGTWAEVFGTDKAGDEVFMAWGFGRYVDRVARAGAAQHRLPMYANAWLGPQPGSSDPGDYPSGGPVARMMDVWKAAAPSLAFLSPDIYITDFAGTLADFHRPDNPIFVPEARPDTGNLFVALGRYKAIGFSPFGIEDLPEDHELFKAYRVLDALRPQIAVAQQEGRILGFRTESGSEEKLTLGGYEIAVNGPPSTEGLFGAGTGSAAPEKVRGYGLVIQTGEEEFLVVGRAASLQFSRPDKQVELDWAQEGRFEKGQWVADRTLNGDERYYLFPADKLSVLRIRVLQRP
jgi:beta-galactosidase GanA